MLESMLVYAGFFSRAIKTKREKNMLSEGKERFSCHWHDMKCCSLEQRGLWRDLNELTATIEDQWLAGTAQTQGLLMKARSKAWLCEADRDQCSPKLWDTPLCRDMPGLDHAWTCTLTSLKVQTTNTNYLGMNLHTSIEIMSTEVRWLPTWGRM